MPIQFQGGPLNGQGTMTDEEMMAMAPPPGTGPMNGTPPGLMPPGAEAAAGPGPAGVAPPGPPPTGPEGDAPDESVLFSTLLESMRGLLSLGTVSEQNKLNLEKASTLVQQIKAAEEKEQESAMTGKLSPAVMRKMGGSGGGY